MAFHLHDLLRNILPSLIRRLQVLLHWVLRRTCHLPFFRAAPSQIPLAIGSMLSQNRFRLSLSFKRMVLLCGTYFPLLGPAASARSRTSASSGCARTAPDAPASPAVLRRLPRSSSAAPCCRPAPCATCRPCSEPAGFSGGWLPVFSTLFQLLLRFPACLQGNISRAPSPTITLPCPVNAPASPRSRFTSVRSASSDRFQAVGQHVAMLFFSSHTSQEMRHQPASPLTASVSFAGTHDLLPASRLILNPALRCSPFRPLVQKGCSMPVLRRVYARTWLTSRSGSHLLGHPQHPFWNFTYCLLLVRLPHALPRSHAPLCQSSRYRLQRFTVMVLPRMNPSTPLAVS